MSNRRLTVGADIFMSYDIVERVTKKGEKYFLYLPVANNKTSVSEILY